MTGMVATTFVAMPQVPAWMGIVLLVVCLVPLCAGACVALKDSRHSRLVIATLAAVGLAGAGLLFYRHSVYATLWIPCDITCWIEALLW